MTATVTWNDDGTVTVNLIPDTNDESETLMRQCFGLGMHDNDGGGDTVGVVASTYQETESEVLAVASGNDGEVLIAGADQGPALEIRLFKEK